MKTTPWNIIELTPLNKGQLFSMSGFKLKVLSKFSKKPAEIVREPKLRVLSYRKYLNTSGTSSKTALVSYLPGPIEDEVKNKPTGLFSNHGAARSICKVLNQLGYSVDVISYDDDDFVPSKKYDIYFLHGGVNFGKLKSYITKPAKLIYYSTGSYWKFHNKKELQRFDEFSTRHKAKLKPDRFIRSSEEEVNKIADAIIVLGNKGTQKTYAKFKHVYSLPGASMIDTKTTGLETKDYAEAKKHFLFIAGPGNIHKGLDLLLDVFSEQPSLHLHIITWLEPDFEKFYHHELYELPNIHTYGYVPHRSKKFYEITKLCAFGILPSCSEGSPGSVLDLMEEGIIPVVSKESHIDVGREGYILKDNTTRSIENQITDLQKLSTAQLKRKATLIQAYTRTQYSVEAFENNLTKIITSIEKQ